jgi:hypothetical protein
VTLGSPLQPLTAPARFADQSSIDDLYREPVTEWNTHELMPGEMLLGAVRGAAAACPLVPWRDRRGLSGPRSCAGLPVRARGVGSAL